MWRNCPLTDFWRQVHKRPLDRKIADLDWKIIHSALPTAAKLSKWKIIPNSICRSCKKQTENTKHIFYDCCHAQTLWQHIEHTTQKLRPAFKLTYENIILGNDLDLKNVKQRLIKHLVDTGKKTLWTFRNMHFHNDSNKTNCVRSLFRCSLQSYIERDFYTATANGTNPQNFNWQIDHLICTVTNNKITVNIWLETASEAERDPVTVKESPRSASLGFIDLLDIIHLVP